MKVPTSYDGVSDTEIIPRTGSVLNSFTNDPELFQRLLLLLPTPEKIKEAHDRFQESYNAALSGDREKLLTKQTDRKLLNRRLSRFASLVKLAAEEDPTVLLKAGLGVQRERILTPAPPLTAPANFRVRHGERHGVMFAKTASVKTAKSYEMQFCEGDPTVEENWKFIGVYATCTGMEMKDLVPGKVYSFRVRAIRSSGPGPWSSYVTLMAI